MADSVLVTTHDLPLAGKLRAGFRHEGYRVEFLTSGEAVDEIADPVLLVLTGGLESDAVARQRSEAAAAGLPVLAILPSHPPEPPAGFAATFAAPPDPEEIVLVGVRTIQRRRLRRATGIVGETDAMMEVMERVVQIAPVDATVLITGESGTGKELVARGVHALSRRRHGAFIPVNVAALSETLLESELFGHEKGAFTGAIDMRKGLFELAHGGTIFLDEIGEMPLQTQTRLLRVLEQQEFHRVGGQKLIRVNVRIIAATNQQLRDQVVAGAFRKDLYYRLNVLSIALPALRDRRQDIPLLVDAFIREAGVRHDRGPFPGISPEAMQILIEHRWPGNVRELRNLIESMVVLTPGREIGADDIPADVRSGDTRMALVPVAQGETAGAGNTPAAWRPQLEFIFRTMMQLRVDIDDLRVQFEHFREDEGRNAVLLPSHEQQPVGRVPGEGRAARGEIGWHDGAQPLELSPRTSDPELEEEERGSGELAGISAAIDGSPGANPSDGTEEAVGAGGEAATPPEEPSTPSGSLAYRPGMTLEEMEREVIQVVLDSVGWNRRRAAELLGIGERTLYRKVHKFNLVRPAD